MNTYIKTSIRIENEKQWDALWVGIGSLGELGPRESRVIMNTASRGLALNWEREKSPDGAPWVPLAKFTQEERERLGFARAHPILSRTGDLKMSFTDESHPRHIADAGVHQGSTLMTVGARDNPAMPNRISVLNYGGVTDTGRMVPARPFIGFNDVAIRWLDHATRAVIIQRVDRL